MFRVDSQKLNWERTPGGLLKAFITLGTAEAPLDYQSFEKGKLTKRTERISLDELKSPQSLATAFGSPVTLGHPKSKRYDGNKEGLLIGHCMQEFAEDNGSVVIAATITDQRADRLIKESAEKYDGLMPEMSPGYTVDQIVRADNGLYQLGRGYDHQALLYPNQGRGSQGVRLRLDAKDAIALDLTEEKQARNFWYIDQSHNDSAKEKHDDDPREQRMKTILVGKKAFNIDSGDADALATAIVGVETERDEALSLAAETEGKLAEKDAEATEAIARADAAEKLVESEKGRADGLDTKVKELEDTRVDADAIANDRKAAIEAFTLVAPTLRADNADFAPDFGWDASDWRKAYLKVKRPDINLDDANSDRIDAMWEVLKPAPEVHVDSTDALKSVVTLQAGQTREDKGMSNKAKRAEERLKRLQGNGKKSTMGAA